MNPSDPTPPVVPAEAVDRDRDDLVRQRIVVLAAGLGGLLCIGFAALESTKSNFDPVERFAMPAIGLFFIGVAVKAWWRWSEAAVMAVVSAGCLLLLERMHHVLHEPNPDLSRVVNAYELLSWFPCLYLFNFLLFEKRRALFFCLVMLAGSVPIMGSGAIGDMHRIDRFEFVASHLFCILFIYILSRLKEHFVATQREAIALRTYAETDFLTGVPNRRSLSEGLAREISRCERGAQTLAVILLDVDHFKQVNDTLGHDEGDRALRRIALVMDRGRRRADLFGRWGGEEFLLVAPDLDLDGARQAAERLRGLVEESSRGTRAHVTASFGVSAYVPGDDVASLVRRADEALIAAKNAGRNRVEAQAA